MKYCPTATAAYLCMRWPVDFVTSALGPSITGRIPVERASTSVTISGAARQQVKLQEHGFTLSSEEIPC